MQINLQQIIYRVPWKRILLLLTLTICLSLTLSSPWIICGYSPHKLGDIKENVAPTTPTLLQGKSTLKWLTFLKVIRPRNLKEISPGCSLEGLMLKLKLQYSGHLMRRADSLEKTLMLGKIEGRKRREWWRMRCWDSMLHTQGARLGFSPWSGN